MNFGVPTTPQRPTPGMFINTPAPNRGGLVRQPSMSQQRQPSIAQPQQQPQQPAQALPAPPAVSAIERAARTINSMLDRDNRYPPLEAYVGQGMSGEYELPTNPAWAPFQKLRTYRLPEAVFEQVDHTQMSTQMGLFAEINHAWVVVDNQVYLWDYTHPNPELVGFEEQPSNITCVKLVKPRAKVFVDTIEYLLVVATVTDIFLIAVECQRGPEGVHGITLYRTGLSTSVRRITVTAIAGSDKTGRIFFGDGSTEDVYELNYQQEDRWFSSKCSKTNHVSKAVGLPALPFYGTTQQAGIVQMVVDDTRNLLYTLSTNSTVKVYHMRAPATLECVITRTVSNLQTMCSHIVRQSEVLNKMEIVSLSPIASTEADHLSLMATTSTGCRLYLSTTSGGWNSDSTSAPNSMQLRHVRFPPDDGQTPHQTNSTQLQPYQGGAPLGINSKYLKETKYGNRFAPGSFFSFVLKSENERNQTLFISAPHSGLLGQRESSEPPRYTETGLSLELVGKIQDMGQVSEPFSARNEPLGFGNELATQFDKPLTEYAIITSFGIETVRRKRLVDIFAALVKYGGGQEGTEADIKKLARQYGLAETAATALAVACNQGSDVGPDSRIAKITDPEVTEFARKVFIEFGGKAHLTESATVEGPSVENVRASPRHDGIAMYVARLVRSIWYSPVIKEEATPAGPLLASAVKVSKLQDIQRALMDLQKFLDDNKSFIEGLAGPEALGRVSSRQEEVELQGEHRALTSLVTLVNDMVEGISFVLLLFEERLEDVMALLDPSTHVMARRMTFQALFSVKEGRDLAKDLVKAIVNRSIAKGSNVESVAESLRRKCGSFCSADDVMIFRGQEAVKKAEDMGANAERGRILLNDSLGLFEQVAKSLTFDNLASTIDQYIRLEFYAGAIRLSLKVAQEWDRGNKALSWIRDRDDPNVDPNDVRKDFYEKRAACYDLVLRVVEAVDQAYNRQGPVADGVVSQVTRRKFEAYEQINNSDDEVFQNYLYDWYMQKGWAERLLEINSPFVVEYLRQSSERDVAHADLLWRYYAHYNDYLSAAETQYQLAKSLLNLPLEKRIEYLSFAKANASTRMTGFSETGVRNRQSRQELLRNIADHLDIANIQDDILGKLKSDDRLAADPARKEQVLGLLNGQIQPLDELYHNYADQAGYYDVCLLIYHAADYRNIPDVRNTWSNLIEQVHKQALGDRVAQPWESLALKVEEIGRRVNMNENVFPVNIVLQLLLQYDIEYYRHDAASMTPEHILNVNLTWPIDVLVRLNAPFEHLVATFEALWYAQEAPFTNRNKKLLVKWCIYSVEQWGITSRRSGALFGSAENAIGLAEFLRVVLGSDTLGRTADDQQWLQRARDVRDLVEEAAR
ncbi:Non-repetitive/WGA-negative nucleoporin C-terminal-domain-containing protein [Boeremia exigua]|uniref:Non-repetitive/WGA-negative nucleoporin C-terminal-domain-containing protein n=1 Tax=Boeremia exigua TaxID=749465 RepID=UPI001E8E5A9F|nr:Non-repetitive/WGA-negative nucleoporin C-terminal-domain-containing protein [Boeremia exigua]KAH6611998.1 Non-repetitive/WGA-negative nucleoporin C-terminal-domain-containing protein [Boeremia exigua]